jgi:hypothetical protein
MAEREVGTRSFMRERHIASRSHRERDEEESDSQDALTPEDKGRKSLPVSETKCVLRRSQKENGRETQPDPRGCISVSEAPPGEALSELVHARLLSHMSLQYAGI